MGKTTWSMIKVLENSLTEIWRLKIKAVTKMDDYFTICQYEKEEPEHRENSYTCFFYPGLFTSFRYLNTIVCPENTECATREESKDFFASSTQPIISWTEVYQSSWDFEFLTLRFCTRLTQNARYDLIHATLHVFHDLWQIWQVWFFSFYLVSLLRFLFFSLFSLLIHCFILFHYFLFHH